MKRSTVSQIISNMLKEHTDIKYLDYDHDRLANIILNIVEECGMKPPLRQRCSILLTDDYVWESEE